MRYTISLFYPSRRRRIAYAAVCVCVERVIKYIYVYMLLFLFLRLALSHPPIRMCYVYLLFLATPRRLYVNTFFFFLSDGSNCSPGSDKYLIKIKPNIYIRADRRDGFLFFYCDSRRRESSKERNAEKLQLLLSECFIGFLKSGPDASLSIFMISHGEFRTIE